MATEMLQKLDLSQSSFGKNFLAKDVGHFLDRYSFASLIIRSGAVNDVS